MSSFRCVCWTRVWKKDGKDNLQKRRQHLEVKKRNGMHCSLLRRSHA